MQKKNGLSTLGESTRGLYKIIVLNCGRRNVGARKRQSFVLLFFISSVVISYAHRPTRTQVIFLLSQVSRIAVVCSAAACANIQYYY